MQCNAMQCNAMQCNACMCVRTYVCTYVCTYICMYVRMYVGVRELRSTHAAEISLRARGSRRGILSSVCLSATKPHFSPENLRFSRRNRVCFTHWRRLVMSFTPTEATIRSSVSDLSIGFSVARFAHVSAPERHFQEMVTLLPV